MALQSNALLSCTPSYGSSYGSSFGFGSFNSANLFAGSVKSMVAQTSLPASTPIALPAPPLKEPIECTTICGKKSEIDSVKQIIKGTNLVNL